jgi:uncharacterized Zn finger protein
MDPYVDDRLRSDKTITFLGFIDDFRKLWETAGKKGKFVRNKPSGDDAHFPAVTYRVVRRLINPEFKDLKPRLRATVRHPDQPNEYIEIYGQIFDVYVEFVVYSLSAEEADELTIEFEDFLQLYKGFFKQNGVKDIFFYEQGEDEVNTDSRFSVHKRTLNYRFLFEKITPMFLNQIEELAIQASILHKENEPHVKEEEL